MQSQTSTPQYIDINKQKVQTQWLPRGRNERFSNLQQKEQQMLNPNRNGPESAGRSCSLMMMRSRAKAGVSCPPLSLYNVIIRCTCYRMYTSCSHATVRDFFTEHEQSFK